MQIEDIILINMETNRNLLGAINYPCFRLAQAVASQD